MVCELKAKNSFIFIGNVKLAAKISNLYKELTTRSKVGFASLVEKNGF